jgi:hypothetical protein
MWIALVAAGVTVAPATLWDSIALQVGIQSGGATLLLVLGLFGVLALIMQISIAMTRLERLVVSTIIDDRVRDALSDEP